MTLNDFPFLTKHKGIYDNDFYFFAPKHLKKEDCRCPGTDTWKDGIIVIYTFEPPNIDRNMYLFEVSRHKKCIGEFINQLNEEEKRIFSLDADIYMEILNLCKNHR